MLSRAWTTRPFFGLEFRSSGPVQVLNLVRFYRSVSGCDCVISCGRSMRGEKSTKSTYTASSGTRLAVCINTFVSRAAVFNSSGFEMEPNAEDAVDGAVDGAFMRYGVVWKCDSSSSCCSVCTRSFTAFARRHHCRACGELVCASCSVARRKLALPGAARAQRGAHVDERAYLGSV